MNEKARNHLDKIERLLRNQRMRVTEIVTALDEQGLFEDIQDVFDKINSTLKEADKEEQKKTIQVLSKSIIDSIKDRGAPNSMVEFIEGKIVTTWLQILKDENLIDIRDIFIRITIDWKIKEDELKGKTNRKNIKMTWLAAMRIVTGGGLLVFDGAKFLFIPQPPTYMFSSFVGGALLFYQGLEGLWKE